jgi:hypothetical protein
MGGRIKAVDLELSWEQWSVGLLFAKENVFKRDGETRWNVYLSVLFLSSHFVFPLATNSFSGDCRCKTFFISFNLQAVLQVES